MLKQTTASQFKGTWADRLHGLHDCGVSFSGKSVLDIGSNMGIVGYEICKQGPSHYHGVEVQQAHVDCARMIFQGVGAQSSFECCDLKDWSPRGRRWDVILCLATRQHVEKQHGTKVADALMSALFSTCNEALVFRGPDWFLVSAVARRHGFARAHYVESPNLYPLMVFEKKRT